MIISIKLKETDVSEILTDKNTLASMINRGEGDALGQYDLSVVGLYRLHVRLAKAIESAKNPKE